MRGRTDDVEQQVIDHLLAEWQKPMRLTTVAQGMAALGLARDRERRWRIGQRLRRPWRTSVPHTQRFEQFRTALGLAVDQARIEQLLQQTREWGLASILLDEDEKLVARSIVVTQEQKRRFPSLEETAQATGQSLEEVAAQFEMLARLGVLASTDSAPPGYRLARGYRRFLKGLGFSFHTVTLASEERFNVPCAGDYILLASRLNPEETVTLDDSCAHCVDRIHIAIARGQVIEALPEEPLFYRGGT